MKQLFIIFVLLSSFSCKEEAKPNSLHIKPPVKTKTVNTLPKKTFDFTSIPKDTLFVTGKHIVFTRPSKKEFELLKDQTGIYEVDSDFGLYTAKVTDSLKNTYKITTTSKRIIAVVESHDTTYIDRLTPKTRISRDPIHYSAILVFNDFFSIYSNVYTDAAYYGLIRDYYTTVRYEKPIEYKYVVSRNGLNIREADGSLDGKFNNGDRVNVLGYTDDIVEVQDKGKTITGRWAIIQWNDNGRTKKRYVFEGFLGDIKDVKVFEDQICTGFKLIGEARYNSSNADLECLSKYLDLELISKKDFNAIHNKYKGELQIRPSVIIKENEDKTQSISLPTKDRLIVYNSKVGYGNSTHVYYGDIDFLNQYVLHHTYPEAEEQFYSFIDRNTGKETIVFPEFPYISIDRKKIISFVFNVYEAQFFIEIYKINKDKSITFEHAFNFVHWLKTYQNEVKWISNTEFAIEIVNQNIWNGSEVKQPQYLKIKLKE